MRKKIYVSFATGLLASVGLFLIETLPMNSVKAASSSACTVPSVSYGTATVNLNVGEAGTYKIWTHMYALSGSADSLMLELDGNSCFVVGNGDVSTQAWSWVGHQNGSAANSITATLSAGTHTVKLIGSEPGVKIDRVLASADQSCTPSGTGDNCMKEADTTKPTVDITSPPDTAVVSGNSVAIKATASDNASVSKVEFYVQGSLVGTSTATPYEYIWDTTGLANQSYTITAKAYDSEGNVASDSITLSIDSESAQTVSQVSNLSSTATESDSVDLKWEGSENADVYRIVRDGTVIGTTDQTSYTDDTAVAGKTYEYSVVAVDSAGDTADPSSTSEVTVPAAPEADTTAPTVPVDVTATAQGTNQINLSWAASSDGVGIEGYDIYRNSDEDKTFKKIATTTATSYGDSSVYDNTTFTYYVIARDAAGNSSEASEQSAATTPAITTTSDGTVRGTIHSSDGRPLAGVRVTIWVDSHRYQATTNWRGRYAISNVPSGKYEISFRKSGYTKDTSSVSLRSNKTRWVDANLRY